MTGATGDILNLRLGRAFFKVSFFLEQSKEDAAHPPRHDGNGGVGLFPAGALLAIEGAEVGRAADRHPTGFDQGPTQPLVTARQEPAMIDLAARAMSRGDHSGISAELLRAGEAFDLIDLGRQDRAQGRPNSR